MAINQITRDDVEFFKSTPGNSTLNDYQRIATKSAIYPGVGTSKGLIYTALKMNGEAGEFAEHVGKAMRDDSFGSKQGYVDVSPEVPLTSERKVALIKEVGDVLWYLSAACNELGITLQQAAVTNLEKLCDRCERDMLQGSGDNR